MLINEIAHEVHENAVEHGWWDSKRDICEIIGLIHSEWSEALEAARAGKEDVYREDGKPEGVAVELIDGVIRILDLLGSMKADVKDANSGLPMTMEQLWMYFEPGDIPDEVQPVVFALHKYTANAVADDPESAEEPLELSRLASAMAIALTWVRSRGIDPLELLLEKHEYNKKRPYKHGKRF